MLLQIDQSEGSLNSILQTKDLQENWYILLLVAILGIIIVWRLFKRKKYQHSLDSEIEQPVSEYQNYQAYLETKATIIAETTKPVQIVELPSKVSPSVKNDNQPEPVAVKTTKKVTIQNEPTTKYIDDKIIAPHPTEVTAIVHLSAKEQSVPMNIGYDPAKIVVHPGQLTYPYIVLPKANAKVTLPQEGRTGRQGYKDADFEKYLSIAFSNILQVDDNKLLLTNSGNAYSPDISLIDTSDGLNLFIDIEIDEPYEGTNDVVNRKAIHYRGCDENRNKAFGDSGWIVIRFAEIQVHQNPNGCCLFIADIISKIEPKFEIPTILLNAQKIDTILQWDKQTAEKMSHEKYREKYLKIDSFGLSVDKIYTQIEHPILKSERNIEKENHIPQKKNSNIEHNNGNSITDLIPHAEVSKENHLINGISERVAAQRKISTNSVLKTFWGFRNSKNEVVISCIYDKVREFSDGLAAVSLNNKWGFIDIKGQVCVPCIYDEVRPFTVGIAMVRLNYKWGTVNNVGILKTPCEYHEICDFSEGMASVKQNNKWGFISMEGNLVIPCIYDSEVKRGWLSSMGISRINFNDGLALVYYNNRCGFIDKRGKEIIPLIYGHANWFSEGFAAVTRNSKYDKNGMIGDYGFINKKGQSITPFVYQNANSFSDGFAAVQKNFKWGYVDCQGRELIPCKYGSAAKFEKGLAKVQLYGSGAQNYGYIDKRGKEIIPCKYAMIGDFSDGLAVVKYEFRYGYIDINGNEVIKPIYREAEPFANGLAKVKSTNSNWDWKWINKVGEIVKVETEGYDLPF